jgi:hypothetical protein
MPSPSSARSPASSRPAKWTCLPFLKSRFACAVSCPIRPPRWTRWYASWDPSRRFPLAFCASPTRPRSIVAARRSRTCGPHQSHRPQHGAQRLDLVRHGADPQEQQAGGARGSAAAIVEGEHGSRCTVLRAGAHLHAHESRRGPAHWHDARHRQALCAHPRSGSPGAFYDRRHDRADRRGMACLDRQGNPRELGISREHGRRSGSKKSSPGSSRRRRI